jgi:hypothetical protein
MHTMFFASITNTNGKLFEATIACSDLLIASIDEVSPKKESI